MVSDNPPRRKLIYNPKPQKRRATRSSAVPKTEVVDEDHEKVSEATRRLHQRFNESHWQKQRKVATPAQVAFTYAANQATTSRVSDGLRVGSLKQSSGLDLMELDDDTGQSSESSCSVAGPYLDPWDYTSYYPNQIPWRVPYSGNPDILNVAEFGEGGRTVEYDETTINPASALGFLNPDESGENNRLLFFQLPQSLPGMKRVASAKGKEKVGSCPAPNQKGSIVLAQDGSSITGGTSRQASSLEDLSAGLKRVASAKGKEKVGSCPAPNQKGSIVLAQDRSSITGGTSRQASSLEDLSAGLMGKLLVYKSGAVKLKLGDILYTVSPGMDCSIAQEVARIDPITKILCEIGNLDGQAVISPDIDYLLDSVIDLD